MRIQKVTLHYFKSSSKSVSEVNSTFLPVPSFTFGLPSGFFTVADFGVGDLGFVFIVKSVSCVKIQQKPIKLGAVAPHCQLPGDRQQGQRCQPNHHFVRARTNPQERMKPMGGLFPYIHPTISSPRGKIVSVCWC